MQLRWFVLFVALLAGCSSTATPIAEPTETNAPTTTSSSAAPPSTTEPSPVTRGPSATTQAPTTTSTVPEDCRRLTDFETEAEQLGWRVTLDGVMGGLSSGDVAFDDSAMIFTGEIVTDGGGFSLLRTPMGGDEFGDASHLVVRLRTDGRGYEMVFKDDGDQRLFHEAKVPSADSGDWQEVRVELSGLIATANGRLVDAPAFNPATVSETGIILKDGIDGSFELEIDWIDACR